MSPSVLQPRVLVRFPPLQVDQLDQHAQLPCCSTVGLVAKRKITQINKRGPRMHLQISVCVSRLCIVHVFSHLGFELYRP